MLTKYQIATGRSRLDTAWKNTTVSWDELCDRLAKTKRTSESCAEYKAMTKDARGKIKDIGGFVGGALCDGHRKATTVISRSLITLDIDFATSDTIRKVSSELSGFIWALYSTHSDTPLAHRYRLILPLDREVSPDEYTPIARAVAKLVGMDLFDDSTYQPERLMYWPSTPADGEYIYQRSVGLPICADVMLGTYTDWRNAAEWPVSSRISQVNAASGKMQEDPLKKDGVIGNFCRAYSISEAIEAFLPEVYEPTTEGRYTFVNGSTSNGVVSYDDKFIYSHHGTDPCSGKLCNAFDMVRLHLFGELDEEAPAGTPINRLPSFTKMTELSASDKKVNYQRAKAAFGGSTEIAENSTEIAENSTPKGQKNTKPNDSWVGGLETCKRNGRVVAAATPANLRLILENRKEFNGILADDEFSVERVVLGDLPWRKVKKDGTDYWTDKDDLGLIDWLSENYGVIGKTAIIDTARLVSSFHAFHPVKDYLEHLPKWDGVKRVEGLLINYLGAEDTKLVRAITRKTLAAAVKRIYHPGCKFDQVLTLVGPQGIGKSSLLALVAGKWFSDTPIRVEANSLIGLQCQGVWFAEMGELTDYKKSTAEAYKNFIAAQSDRFRIPYDRSFQTKDRQFILTATTNDPYFLKGEEGNRRFWVVNCQGTGRNLWEELPQQRDQIWAEVLTYYEGESLRLNGELELEMLELQANHNELADDIRVDAILSYMSQQVPVDWSSYSRQDRDMFLRYGTIKPSGKLEMMQRPWAGYEELARECLNMKFDPYTKKKIKALIKEAGMECIGPRKDKAYGSQKRWIINPTTDVQPNQKVVWDSTTLTTESTESSLAGSQDNPFDYSDIY